MHFCAGQVVIISRNRDGIKTRSLSIGEWLDMSQFISDCIHRMVAYEAYNHARLVQIRDTFGVDLIAMIYDVRDEINLRMKYI